MQVDLIISGTDGLQDGSVVSTDGSNSASLDLSQVNPGTSVKVHLRTAGGYQLSSCNFVAPTHCLVSLDNINFLLAVIFKVPLFALRFLIKNFCVNNH